jgi:hypothetical protein
MDPELGCLESYVWSLNSLPQVTNSAVSTIAPKESYMEDVLRSTSPFHTPTTMKATPDPITPFSSYMSLRSVTRADKKVEPENQEEPTKATPTSRRSAKLSSATSSSSLYPNSPLSNNNKRRQTHNASAMRSRVRLNETIDKMWETIPGAHDREKKIGRAEKVAVAIDYIKYLGDKVKELEEGRLMKEMKEEEDL